MSDVAATGTAVVRQTGLRLVQAAPDGQSRQEGAPKDGFCDSRPYGWILHPDLDILFCCGGLVWILFAAHYFLVGPAATGPGIEMLAIIAVLGTHLLGETHTAATLVRVYRTPEVRRRFSLYTHWAAIACGALALAGLFIGGLVAIFSKIYLIWVIQHFTAQTYGLTLVYCFKRGYRLSEFEKRALWVLMHATMAFAVLRQFTYREWGSDSFLGQQLPFWGPLPEWVFSGATGALVMSGLFFSLLVLRKALRERSVIPFPALLMVATGVLIFVFGKDITGTLWLYVPAFYHGSQYLVMSTAHYLKERGLPVGVSTHEIASLLGQPAALRYFGLLVLAGTFIYIGVPRLLEQFGFDYATAFAVIFTVVNFHHFLTDQAIWKLRDPAVRKLLI